LTLQKQCANIKTKKEYADMGEVKWKQVNVKQIPRRGSEAFARVGQGHISLSATACSMIEDVYDYGYVEVHCGMVNNNAARIGLRFNKAESPNSLRLMRRKYKDKFVGGLDITSRALITEFFGKSRDNISKRHPVEKIESNMISIDITKEI